MRNPRPSIRLQPIRFAHRRSRCALLQWESVHELLDCRRLTTELRLICDAEGNVNRRGNRACRLQMARLVIEEDVRLQHSEDLALLNSAEKECIVCHDAPTFKSLVRARGRGHYVQLR